MTAPDYMQRANRIVLVLGRKNSGKSWYLRHYWTMKEPRLVTLDYTTEARELYPDAIYVHSYEELAGALHTFLAHEVTEWHVVAHMPDSDVARMYALFVPSNSKTVGIARAFGGVAVECDEVSFVAPLHLATDHPVAQAAIIGRHHGFSQFYATQRPQSVSRIISSQADIITSLRMHEPRDRKFLADTVGVAFAEIVRDLPARHHAEYHADSALVVIRDPAGKEIVRADIADLTRDYERGVQIPLFRNTGLTTQP